MHGPLVPIVEERAGEEDVQWEAPSDLLLGILLKHAPPAGLAKAQLIHNGAGHMPLHIAAAGGSAAVCESLLRSANSGTAAALINTVAMQVRRDHGLH